MPKYHFITELDYKEKSEEFEALLNKHQEKDRERFNTLLEKIKKLDAAIKALDNQKGVFEEGELLKDASVKDYEKFQKFQKMGGALIEQQVNARRTTLANICALTEKLLKQASPLDKPVASEVELLTRTTKLATTVVENREMTVDQAKKLDSDNQAIQQELETLRLPLERQRMWLGIGLGTTALIGMGLIIAGAALFVNPVTALAGLAFLAAGMSLALGGGIPGGLLGKVIVEENAKINNIKRTREELAGSIKRAGMFDEKQKDEDKHGQGVSPEPKK